MMYLSSLLTTSTFIVLAKCHGVILGAQGIDGSPTSIGFQVDPAIARNCINISPCQQDTTIIRDAEIDANVVNQCGRTQLTGNIDVGENTENAIAAKNVTEVAPGTEMQVTIHQVNADGAGPYTCDLDETSNTGVISQNLTVANNVPGANGLSQVEAKPFIITVKMPDQFQCTGGSTGDICTVRCRNNALAGPFGGCFAVRQAGSNGQTNNANSIRTADPAQKINNQILVNQAGFPDAVQANKNATDDQATQSLKAVEALLQNSVVAGNFPTQTPEVDNVNNGGNSNNDNNNNKNNNNRNGGKNGNKNKNRKNNNNNNNNNNNGNNNGNNDNAAGGATRGGNNNNAISNGGNKNNNKGGKGGNNANTGNANTGKTGNNANTGNKNRKNNNNNANNANANANTANSNADSATGGSGKTRNGASQRKKDPDSFGKRDDVTPSPLAFFA